MFQKNRAILFEGRRWHARPVYPADFFSCAFWPFAFYRLLEDEKSEKGEEIKREWKIKPKNLVDDEAKLEAALKNVFKAGLGIKFDHEYDKIKENNLLHSVLLSEIYALSYNLTLEEKLFTPTQSISREFAEVLAIKAKALQCEPYALLKDLSKERPELYNPRRYDFNIFILAAGWDRERREIEKAQAAAKIKFNSGRK